MALNKQKKAFIAAVSELGAQKGISNEIIQNAIVEGFKVSLNKKFEDELKIVNKSSKNKLNNKEGEKLASALIRVDVVLEKAKIDLYREWEVKNDEDITDDFIEISLEDAKEKNPKLKVGDFYEEEIPFESLTKKDVDRFISNFKQKISQAEKDALLVDFADKIGHIYTGEVQKFDNTLHTCLVTIGKANVMLHKGDLIGDETFKNGDNIKVYVVGFEKDEKKTATIKVSRTCKEFLAKLFENEVNEIGDGSVVIKDIARRAGIRSKVVVAATDPNVDPSGACIGKNGERIHRIVAQLGNGKEAKEKVDVILYHINLGAYLAEILKPGEVIGINFSDDNKEVLVICKNDTMKLAVGQGGVNVKLAMSLTGLQKINIINESDLEKEGVTSFKAIEEYLKEDEQAQKEEEMKRFREHSIRMSEAKKADENGEIIEDQPLYNEEFDDEDVEDVISNEVEASETEEIKEEPVKEVKETPVTPVEKREVKTTTTLEMLEKSLEEEKKNKKDDKAKKSFKKKDEDKKVEVKEENKKEVKKMDIYTEEELKEFEDEDFDDEFEDNDWSEYDDDDLYEDK